MPKIPSNASDKSHGDLADTMEKMLSEISLTTNPVVIAGVQRKANIGNFETIDVYCAAALPVTLSHGMDKEAMIEAMGDKIELLFHLTSKETGERYQKIKGN